LALIRFGLYPFRSPLLGVSRLFSSPQGTEMCQFPWFPPPTLCIQAGVALHDECWVSPFGHPRIEAQSTAPRGFSQSLTSFIGSWRQGIHRWLFIAWKNYTSKSIGMYRCSCLLCSSQGAPARPRRTEGAGSTSAEGQLPQNGREDVNVATRLPWEAEAYDRDGHERRTDSAPTRCPGTGWLVGHLRCGKDSLERR
jgi:hypothetical protein